MLYEYKGVSYPDYLKRGPAHRFILEAAKHFCTGYGFDVGAGGPTSPLRGALAIDVLNGNAHHALNLPDNNVDYIFSSHCLEHLENPVAALEHWKSRLRPGGVLFLYLLSPQRARSQLELRGRRVHSGKIDGQFSHANVAVLADQDGADRRILSAGHRRLAVRRRWQLLELVADGPRRRASLEPVGHG
jgi:SAM-dependent methyltransferase